LINTDTPIDIINRLKLLRPTMINRYLRKYYQSANKNYRITLDSKQQYYKVYFNQISKVPTSHRNNLLVLELKYDAKHDNKAHCITNQFPFRLTKNSKYVNGIIMNYYV